MGSGFNFFTNAIDKTPGTAVQWTDIDASADIPIGATGVICKIVNTASTTARGAIRKNGSTSDMTGQVRNFAETWAFCGVDANRIFEAYIAATTMKIYLIGYTTDGTDFLTNWLDRTPGSTGSWQDVDVSADIPSDATGVICLIQNTNTTTIYDGGIRKNGSTDAYPAGDIVNLQYTTQLCGVDASRIFEAYIENTAVKIWLCGYTKAPATFFTNGVERSLGQANQWLDIDVTNDTDPAADGAILHIKNNAASTQTGDVRKNGSTDDNSTNSNQRQTNCKGAAIGMDTSQIFEGRIGSTGVDFFLIGYCKPAAGAIERSVTESMGSISDSVAIALRRDRQVTEAAVSVSDSTERALHRNVQVAEPSIAVADSPVSTRIFSKELSEALGVPSDLVQVILTRDTQVSEPAISVSDGVIADKAGAGQTLERSPLESIGAISDSVQTQITRIRNIVETLGYAFDSVLVTAEGHILVRISKRDKKPPDYLTVS